MSPEKAAYIVVMLEEYCLRYLISRGPLSKLATFFALNLLISPNLIIFAA